MGCLNSVKAGFVPFLYLLRKKSAAISYFTGWQQMYLFLSCFYILLYCFHFSWICTKSKWVYTSSVTDTLAPEAVQSVLPMRIISWYGSQSFFLSWWLLLSIFKAFTAPKESSWLLVLLRCSLTGIWFSVSGAFGSPGCCVPCWWYKYSTIAPYIQFAE